MKRLPPPIHGKTTFMAWRSESLQPECAAVRFWNISRYVNNSIIMQLYLTIVQASRVSWWFIFVICSSSQSMTNRGALRRFNNRRQSTGTVCLIIRSFVAIQPLLFVLRGPHQRPAGATLTSKWSFSYLSRRRGLLIRVSRCIRTVALLTQGPMAISNWAPKALSYTESRAQVGIEVSVYVRGARILQKRDGEPFAH